MDSTASRPPGFPNRWQREASVESVSSASPHRPDHVSGLGLSSASSGSVAAPRQVALEVAPATERGNVLERVEWEDVQPSKRVLWNRNIDARREAERSGWAAAAGPSGWEAVAPEMGGLCFRCYEPGHRKRDCMNAEVCVRCWQKGHPAKGCTRPRSPSALEEEELRRLAMAKMARHRSPEHAGQGRVWAQVPGEPSVAPPPPSQPPLRPWGFATWEQEASPVRAPPVMLPPPPPLPPPPAAPVSSAFMPPMPAWPPLRVEPIRPAAAPVVDEVWEQESPPLCVVRRSESIGDLEHRLRFALVASVGGRRPAVSCEQVVAALKWRGIPWNAFSVHSFAPEDFLVVWESEILRRHIATLTPVLVAGAPLIFRNWNRQSQATQVTMRSKVSLVIEGVPPHAWDMTVVEDLLGRSCAVDEIAPETSSRADLSLFKLTAWTSNVDAIPVARMLAVPEPVPSVEHSPSPAREFSDEVRSPRAPVTPASVTEIHTLQYKVLVHIARVVDELSPEDWLRNCSQDGGQSGIPDDDSGDGYGGGGGRRALRSSRVMAWRRGVPDQRRGPGGTTGQRRRLVQSDVAPCGPVVWGLPRMDCPSSCGIQIPKVRPRRMETISDKREPGNGGGIVPNPASTAVKQKPAVEPIVQEIVQKKVLDPIVEEVVPLVGTAEIAPEPLAGSSGKLMVGSVEICSEAVQLTRVQEVQCKAGTAFPGATEQDNAVWLDAPDSLPAGAEPEGEVIAPHAGLAASKELLSPAGSSTASSDDSLPDSSIRSGFFRVELSDQMNEVQVFASEIAAGESLGGTQSALANASESSYAGPNSNMLIVVDETVPEVDSVRSKASLDVRLIPAAGADALLATDVQGQAAVLGSGAGEQGVGVVDLPPAPEVAGLDEAQRKELLSLGRVKKLCASILKTLAPPLLKEVEDSKHGVVAEPCTPMRTTRRAAAAGVSHAKKASAAESVLLKAFGICPNNLAATEEDLLQFKEIFDSPVGDHHLRVVASIFGKMLPSSFEREEHCQLAVLGH